MRLTVYILVLFVTYLSSIPCGDSVDETHCSLVTEQHEDGNSQEEHGSHCSPLCTCACTPTVLEELFSIEKQFSTKRIQQQYSFIILPTNKVYHKHWQPPRYSS